MNFNPEPRFPVLAWCRVMMAICMERPVRTDTINDDFGTIYKVSLAGAFTVLHRFSYQEDAQFLSPLISGNNGNFYGVSGQGGANYGGYVFKIAPLGEITELGAFANSSQTFLPQPLLLGKDGNLYGVTSRSGYPGPDYGGTVFQMTPAGVVTILHYFPFVSSRNVISPLCQDNDGNLYGMSVAALTDKASFIVSRLLEPTLRCIHLRVRLTAVVRKGH